ncbi:hypothetical protein NUW54_g14581 [Trametes sanguinea]|uniref:Uncharacterized protein n=1 Tax=Trametes sanguinea TaxID=158606 RepID=A0ACC1MBP6_9APHY|nr:hypothetical protein NUW54_g14581 [Trametes sanguinea]
MPSTINTLDTAPQFSDTFLKYKAKKPKAAQPSHPQSTELSKQSAAEQKRTEELAAELGSHEDMIMLLIPHLEKDSWIKPRDRIADQLPPDYKPGNETAIGTGTKRNQESAQLNTDAPRPKRTCSSR